MSDTNTSHRGYVKPEPGASPSSWGVKLNNDLDSIDADMNAVITTADAAAMKVNNLSDLTDAATARTNLGVPTGTSGAVLPFLNVANSWSGLQTLGGGANLTSAAAPAANAVGYLGSPQSVQNGSYTLQMSDAGKSVMPPSAAHSLNVTIPPNSSVAFPLGTRMRIHNFPFSGAGSYNSAQVLEGIGVQLEWNGGNTGSRFISGWGHMEIEKIAPDKWRIILGSGII